MKKLSFLIALSVTVSSPTFASSSGGLPGLETTVEDNYVELDSRIAVLENSTTDTIDYRDYQTTVNSKTFKLQGNFCGDSETRSFSRSEANGVTSTLINRTRTNPLGLCHNKTFHYESDANSRRLLAKTNNSFSGVVKSIDTVKEPVVMMTTSTEVGKPIGTGTEMFREFIGQPKARIGVLIDTTTIIASNVSVKVPYGTFDNCIQVHRLRNSPALGSFNRMSWHCKGVGEVKRLQYEALSGEYRIWKLTSFE